MVGAPVNAESIHLMDLEFVCVKAPVFSFNRLRGCDPLLGVEMRSTGEVRVVDGLRSTAIFFNIKKKIKEGIEPEPLDYKLRAIA